MTIRPSAHGRAIALKHFYVEEGSTENMSYRIVVKDGYGQVVEDILRPTMEEAQTVFEQRGYEHTGVKGELL